MPKPYVEEVGSRSDCTAIDSEHIMSALNEGNFALSTSASTYSPEELTISYIGSIFNAITNIETSWNNCKQTAGKYISDFEDVPMPEDISDYPTNFEDEGVAEVQSLGTLGIASVTAASLKIRQDSNTNSSVLGYCSSGDKFDIIGYSENGNWVEVRLADGTKGYISKKYVSVSENSNVQPQPQAESTQQPTETLEQPTVGIPEQPSGEIISGQVKTEGGNLNIRDENNNIIGKLPNKTDIKIVGQVKTPDGKEWYQIDLGNGKTGRVSTSYVNTNGAQISSSAPSPSVPLGGTTTGTMKGFVNTTTGSLRVRNGPSFNSGVVGYLPRNSEVEILEYNNNTDWAKISYNGQEMYVYRDKIQVKGE